MIVTDASTSTRVNPRFLKMDEEILALKFIVIREWGGVRQLDNFRPPSLAA